MADEIEYKFKIKNDNWKQNILLTEKIIQGYLSLEKDIKIKLEQIEQVSYITINYNNKTIHCGINNKDYENIKTLNKNNVHLSENQELTIRARLVENPETHAKTAFLTIKGPSITAKNGASSNPEFEYSLHYQDTENLLQHTEYKINKTRHTVQHDVYKWEVDIFKDELDGIKIAELEVRNELETPDSWPRWIGENVSDDHQYKNVKLAIKAQQLRTVDWSPTI